MDTEQELLKQAKAEIEVLKEIIRTLQTKLDGIERDSRRFMDYWFNVEY